MISRQDLDSLAETLKREDNFIIATHVMPDGDTIGSVLALGLLLRKMGKQVAMCWPEEVTVPPHYRFVPGINELTKPERCPAAAHVFVAVDCANIQRLGKLQENAGRADILINLDHHRDNTKFGKINLVSEKCSASAEIIYELAKRLDSNFDRDIAICLYVGLVTDTGRFQYGNTSDRSFEMALDLVRRGVSPKYIFENVYENFSYSALKLLGRVLAQAQILPEANLIYSVITNKDLGETNTTMEETDNFIDYLRTVKAADVAVIFKEMSDGTVKVSMRSKRMDVALVAEKFGGGGHPNAAGFSSSKDTAEILQNIVREITRRQRAANN
jgi:phosphoesterase RecJ-like protein